MQGRNAKTTKTTTKVQKAAKGCKRLQNCNLKKISAPDCPHLPALELGPRFGPLFTTFHGIHNL